MAVLTREAAVAALVGAGIRRDVAAQYSDAFVEYQSAAAHLAEHGAIVQHPRTGTPIPNPYGLVRDAALRRLQGFKGPVVDVAARVLWGA